MTTMTIIKSVIRNIKSAICTAAQYFRNITAKPVNQLYDKMALNINMLPVIFRTPYNIFILIMCLILMTRYIGNIICNVVGIIYPIMYSLTLMQQNANANINNRIQNLMLVNKYWMIFSAMSLFEIFFNRITLIIPGYFYAKLGIIYLLIRSDFALSDTIYLFLNDKYNKFLSSMGYKLFISKINAILDKINNSPYISLHDIPRSCSVITNRVFEGNRPQPLSATIEQPPSATIEQPESPSITMEQPQPPSATIEQPQSITMEQPQSITMEQPESITMEQPESQSITMEQPQ